MPDRLIINPGRRFGRLRVVREGPGQPINGKTYRRRTMICRCSCGKSPDVEVQLYSLTSGGTQSCGCLRRELAPGRSRAVAPIPRVVRSPRERELARKSSLVLAALVVDLERRNASLIAELGAALAELDMERGQYR